MNDQSKHIEIEDTQKDDLPSLFVCPNCKKSMFDCVCDDVETDSKTDKENV